MGVDAAVDSPGTEGAAPLLEVRLLGPLTLSLDGHALPLPGSRKLRGLLGFLALAERPVGRSRLCDLFWEVPSDPRGELRWCLSRLRRLLDRPGRPRVLAEGDAVRLDLTGCRVDALELAAALEAPGLPEAGPELFASEFLEGLELDACPDFQLWLQSQRRRLAEAQLALLAKLAQAEGPELPPALLQRWLALAPLDLQAHRILLAGLARTGQSREAERHLASACRRFAAEGVDSRPLRAAWQELRSSRLPAEPRLAIPAPEPEPGTRRRSIAVLPFGGIGEGPPELADVAFGLSHDLIVRLARLRSLLVIAPGTMLTLRERQVSADTAGRLLEVDFLVNGTVRHLGGQVRVTVELAERASGRIVWAELYDRPLGQTFVVLDELGDRIVAAVAAEIEAVERARAMLRQPGSLDAWGAHHRGLWHMYRFSRPDNEQARRYFELAVRLDPGFSRPYAGLSFTHFQDAFQGWAPARPAIELALRTAGQSLAADERDPAAHWAMGRAHWLEGRQDQAVAELEQAVELSPNFALGHYTLAFVHCQAGDAATAIAASDQSRRLSPCDPLLFGMLGARAMALARQGRFEEAAQWGLRAASQPNAHAHILAIAAYALALAGRVAEGRAQMAQLRRSLPGYRIDDFLRAMRFSSDAVQLFR
uniref:transcriptional regulator n=1 Tax=Geminicoccus flavidas TaxID=2506407 RepID=UPI001359FDCC